jgi:CubicO group peptidase (beta-lactamase class C family)
MPIDSQWLLSFQDKVSQLAIDESIPAFSCAIILPTGVQFQITGASKHTLFPIGSISKSFAAALTAILVNKGLLKWTDPISKFNIKFKLSNPDLHARLTVADLLSHMNPLPAHTLTELSEFGFTRDELLAKLEYIPITESEFSYNYQNVLFAGIAQIIEHITGLSYEQSLHNELLEPLGMTETTASESKYIAYPDKAMPHINRDDKIEAFIGSNYWLAMGPPSCISCSITDLMKWMNFNLSNYHGILNRIHFPSPWAKPPYAMGWWEADDARKVLCSTGGITGFDAVIALIPSLNMGIAVTSNLTNSRFPYLVANEFVRTAIDDPTYNCTAVLKVERPLANTQIPAHLFEGKYYNPILETLEISTAGIDGAPKFKIRIAKNGVTGILTPFAFGPKQHNEHPDYALLRNNPSFKITWQGTMQAAGEAYYDEDRLAAVEDETGNITHILFLADSIYKDTLIALKMPNVQDDNTALPMSKAAKLEY